jgi:GxxExxY protein
MKSEYDQPQFLHRELTEKVIGVFYDVYNELGFGFLESVYQSAMVMALKSVGLKAEGRVKLPVHFRGVIVGEFVADVFVDDKLILELKAVEDLATAHEAQLLNYLKATPVELGLLLNFGPKPKIKRFAFSNERKRFRPPVSVEGFI